MKQVFKVFINGKFRQYLAKGEVKLLKWESGIKITLEPVVLTKEEYKIFFGK